MNDITDRPQLPKPPGPPLDIVREPGLGGPALLFLACAVSVGVGVAAVAVARMGPPVQAAPLIFPVDRTESIGAERLYTPMAKAITPITSLGGGANRPAELGGSTTGSLYASADRIDIYARSAATATLYLVEYQPDDGKWTIHGNACSVATDLVTCRYVAKRGSRYWHVYKSAGSVAYVGVEPSMSEGAGLGSIEPAGSSGVELSDDEPEAIGTAAPGASEEAARADHVHAHGNQSGGSLHPDVVAGANSGFMSGADKLLSDRFFSAIETKSGPGALGVTLFTSILSPSAPADDVTLADGTPGQLKLIRAGSGYGAGASSVVTPATASGFTTITFAGAATTVGAWILLQWQVGGWVVLMQAGGLNAAGPTVA